MKLTCNFWIATKAAAPKRAPKAAAKKTAAPKRKAAKKAAPKRKVAAKKATRATKKWMFIWMTFDSNPFTPTLLLFKFSMNFLAHHSFDFKLINPFTLTPNRYVCNLEGHWLGWVTICVFLSMLRERRFSYRMICWVGLGNGEDGEELWDSNMLLHHLRTFPS